MLNVEQKKRLDTMCKNYLLGIKRTHKISHRLLFAWVLRYRLSMERVLQKQGKH